MTGFGIAATPFATAACTDIRCDHTGHDPRSVRLVIPILNDVPLHDASGVKFRVEGARSVHSLQ